jgi:hypothetical protein
MKSNLFALAVAFVGLAAAPAVAQSGAKAGLLSCRTGPSVGLVVGSRQQERTLVRTTTFLNWSMVTICSYSRRGAVRI